MFPEKDELKDERIEENPQVKSSTVRKKTAVILPGLDGNVQLRERFAQEISDVADGCVIGFPPDRITGFDELTEHVLGRLPDNGRFALIAESFAGPIALRVAQRMPDRVWALVLVGTYATSPIPFPLSLIRFLIRPMLFRMKPPAFLIRTFITNSPELDYLMPLFQRVAVGVKPEIWAGRLRAAFKMDAREELKNCRAPILMITAKHDRILYGSAARQIQKLRPDAEVRDFNSGHCMLECWPERIAAEMREFLKRHAPEE